MIPDIFYNIILEISQPISIKQYPKGQKARRRQNMQQLSKSSKQCTCTSFPQSNNHSKQTQVEKPQRKQIQNQKLQKIEKQDHKYKQAKSKINQSSTTTSDADPIPLFRKGHIIANAKKNIVYKAMQLIGRGTFGTVLSVVRSMPQSQSSPQQYIMALKIIKKQPAYIKQGMTEIKNLQQIAKYEQLTNGDRRNYLKVYDGFMWQGHLCIAMELLDNSILNMLEISEFKGLEMKWIEKWTKELLLSLAKIHKIGIIHCDIKPQNIMFRPQCPQKPVLIDYSSSCTGTHIYSYIQSRFYRSPEVLLGIKPYTQKIDIWSLGCVLAEMYLGLPLFPGGSQYDQIIKIWAILGSRIQNLKGDLVQKYFYWVEQAKNTTRIDKQNGNFSQQISQDSLQSINKVKLIPKPIQVFIKQNPLPKINPCYFEIQSLDELASIRNPHPKDVQNHELFIDLLKRMLVINPEERISAEQAFLHPFVGGICMEMEQVLAIADARDTNNRKTQGTHM